MLEVTNSSHEMLDIDLLACLFPDLLNSFTVFPVGSTAADESDPVIDGILNIGEKIKLVFIVLDAIGKTKCTFSSNELIPILIVLHEEEGEKSKNYGK